MWYIFQHKIIKSSNMNNKPSNNFIFPGGLINIYICTPDTIQLILIE
jgi:hypothetical protein